MIEDSSPGSSQAPTDRTDGQKYRFSHDHSETEPISVSIIRAVATVSEVDPISLQPRLYDVIDADALETLLSPASVGSEVEITFQFGSYEVTVRGSGTIIVQDETPAQ